MVFFAYVIAYIDRSNVAVAKLTMAPAFGWANDTYSVGAAMFFIGYFLLEIPGAIIVERWSARLWISRIMISWGIIAALQAAVQTPTQFYVGRFFLGLAEAGFFPGVIVYLAHWFPRRDRARAMALFIMAAPVAQIVSPRLSYPLLRMGTTEVIGGETVVHAAFMGLAGWQWVFIVWGIPAVLFGIAILWLMTDRPADARWLSSDEKAALLEEIKRDRLEDGSLATSHSLAGFRDPRVWLLAGANFSIVCGHYGVEMFLPSILERWYGLSLGQITWLVMLPFVAMLLGQFFTSVSSDRTGERWWHTATPMYVGAVALFATPFTQGSLPLTLLGFALGLAGIRSYLAPFFTLPRLFLGGSAAAGSIGLINAIGNLGGFVGPIAVGHVEVATGSFRGGLWFLAATAATAATFIVVARQTHRRGLRARATLGLSEGSPTC